MQTESAGARGRPGRQDEVPLVHPSVPPPGEPAGVRELELDDRFWRDALDALQAGEADLLRSSTPAFADALDEVARQAREDAALVGVRFAGADRNPRLLAFLAAAWLARTGLRAVDVDLSPDLRWLERLTGLDLKQGLVDHVHYGVPLERCVRDTAFPGLAVLTGGTRFLTGSPFDDAPAVRGALDRLKQHFQVVVLALPSSEPASETGVLALCDALLAVSSGDAPIEPVGRERLLVRLVGDPDAAEELAAAAHRFVGPLPGLFTVARPASARPAPAGAASATGAPGRGLPRPPSTTAEADEELKRIELLEERDAERLKPDQARVGALEPSQLHQRVAS